MATLQQIIDFGYAEKLPASDILAAIGEFRTQAESGIDANVEGEENRFTVGASIDRAVHTASEQVRLREVSAVAEALLPVESERVAFFQTLAEDPKFEKTDVPPWWNDIADRLDSVSAPLETANVGGGGPIYIEGTNQGDLRVRKVDGENVEALVTGPQGGKTRVRAKFDRDSLQATVKAEREEAIKTYNQRTDSNVPLDARAIPALSDEDFRAKVAGSSLIDAGGAFNQAREDTERKLAALSEEEVFISKAGPNPRANYSVKKQLPKTAAFTDQLPDSVIEGLTLRPLVGLTAELAKAGQVAVNAVSDNPDASIFDSESVVSNVAPGTLGTRFVNPDAIDITEALGSGVQSLASLLIPGGVAKLAGGAVKGLGITAAGANAAGLGTLASTAFTSRYGSIVTDAMNEQDPDLAARKMRYAPWMAAASAIGEMGSELVFPEHRMFGKMNIGSRMRSLALAPLQEGTEEGLSALSYNTVALATDAPVELDDVGRNIVEGTIAGGPFGVIQAGKRHVRPNTATAELHKSMGYEGVAEAQGIVAKGMADHIAEHGEAATALALVEGTLLGDLGAEVTGLSESLPIDHVLPFVAETIELMELAPGRGDIVRERMARKVEEENPVENVAPQAQQAVAPAPADELEAVITPEGAATPEISQTPPVAAPGPAGEVAAAVSADAPAIAAAASVSPVAASEVNSAVSTLGNGLTTRTAPAALNPAQRSELAQMLGRDTPPVASPGGFAGRVIDTLQKLTGRPIVVVNDPGLDSLEGKAAPSGQFTVVNLASKQAISKLVGHEVSHLLESTPEWSSTLEAIRKTPAFQNYRSQIRGEQGYSENQVDKEFMADLLGESTRTRNFMAQLRGENPGAFKRLANNIIDYLGKLWEDLKGEVHRPDATPGVENIREIRDMLANMVRESGAQPVVPAAEAQESRNRGPITESDLDYLNALNTRNIAAADAEVSKARKAAGFSPKLRYSGFRYDESKPPGFIYGPGRVDNVGGNSIGYYFTDGFDQADAYQRKSIKGDDRVGRINKVYLQDQNPLKFDKERYTGQEMLDMMRAKGIEVPAAVEDRWRWWHSNGLEHEAPVWKWINPNHMQRSQAWGDELRDAITAAGFDSIQHPDSSGPLNGVETATATVMFDNRQIKLADTVVLDDQGQIIPPSRRFSTSEDIRESRNIPVKFIGTQRGLPAFEDEPAIPEEDLYNIDIPQESSPVGQTTFNVPSGASAQEIQDNARRKFAEAGLIPEEVLSPESRNIDPNKKGFRRSQFSGLLMEEMARKIPMQRLVKVADQVIKADVTKASSERDLIGILRKLADRDGPLQQAIGRGIDAEFADNIREAGDIPGERAVLRAQVAQVMIGRVIEAAALSYLKGSTASTKRSRKLFEAAKKAAYNATIDVPVNRYAAARILRSTQIGTNAGANTETAALLADFHRAMADFIQEKFDMNAEDVADVEAAADNMRDEAAREAAGAASYGGRVDKLRSRVKSAVRKAASWLGFSSESVNIDDIVGKSFDEGQTTLMNQIKALLLKFENDYQGNIDPLLEKLADAAEFMEGDVADNVLKHLRDATLADMKAAQLEQEGRQESHRRYDAAARRFITQQDRDRTKTGPTEETANFRALRDAVVAGRVTPKQAAAGFIRLGGDKSLRAALTQAFESYLTEKTTQPTTDEQQAAAEAATARDAEITLANLEDRTQRLLNAALAEQVSDKLGLTKKQYASRLLAEYVSGKPVPLAALADAWIAAGAQDRAAVEAALNDAMAARLVNLDKRSDKARARFEAAVKRKDAAATKKARAALDRTEAEATAERDRIERSLEGIAENLIDKAIDGFRGRPKKRKEKTGAEDLKPANDARKVASDYAKNKPGVTEAQVRAAFKAANVRDSVADDVIESLTATRALNSEIGSKKAQDLYNEKSDDIAKKDAARAANAVIKSKEALLKAAASAVNKALGVESGRGPSSSVGLRPRVRKYAAAYAAGATDITEADIRDGMTRLGITGLEQDRAMAHLEAAREIVFDKKAEAAETKLDTLAESAIGRNRTVEFDKDGNPKTGRTAAQSLTDSIWDVLTNNPSLSVKNRDDMKKIVEKLLIERGFTPLQAEERAQDVMDTFTDKLDKIAEEVELDFIRRFGRGKIDETTLRKAIRLGLFDPDSSMMENIAGSKGWKSLSDDQLMELHRNAELAGNIVDPQVRLSVLLDQMRIINKAANLNPALTQQVSSAVRSSLYSGLGSLATNIAVPALTAFVTTPVRTFIEQATTNPRNAHKYLYSTIKAWATALKEGGLAGAIAFKHEAALGLSSAKDTDTNRTEGHLAVDALTRRADLAMARIRDPKTSIKRKAWESVALAMTAGRMVWKVLGALDSLSIAALSRFHTDTRLAASMLKNGVDIFAEYDAFMLTAEAGIRHAVETLGLDPVRAAKEMMARTAQGFYTEALVGFRNKGGTKISANAFEFHKEARFEALSIMGNHSEVQGLISRVGNNLAESFSSPMLLGLGSWLTGPVRIIANIADAGMWWMPGIGIARYMAEKSRIKQGKDQVFHLSAGSAWQLQRRKMESIVGTVLTTALYALFKSQPDDDEEKWFTYTGAHPLDPAERAKWLQQGLTEFTLYLGRSRDGRRAQIRTTRGVLEYLTFPLLAASSISQFAKGEESTLQAIKKGVYGVGAVGLPGLISLGKALGIFQTGDDETLKYELAFRASTLVPFSGLQRTFAKLDEVQPQRRTEESLYQALLPASALWADDGKLTLRNALGENPYAKESVWNTLSRMNLPIGFLDTKGPHDSALSKLFSKMGYDMPAPTSFKTFLKGVEDREQDVLDITGRASLEEVYNDWVTLRATAVRDLVEADEEPEGGKDLRFLSEIVDADDEAAFKTRMSAIWRKANNIAKEELGIQREEE